VDLKAVLTAPLGIEASDPSPVSERKGVPGTQVVRVQIAKALLLLVIVVFAFYPQSTGGVINEGMPLYVYYGIASGLALLYLLLGSIKPHRLAVSLVLLVYMWFVSLVSVQALDSQVSLARLVPVTVVLILFSEDIFREVPHTFLARVLEALTIVVVAWNFGLILGVNSIINFTIRYYSQFTTFTVETQIAGGKPIFTFGVHTHAAFFYMLLFYMWYRTVLGIHSRKRYYVYMVVLLIDTTQLSSYTAALFAGIMAVLLLRRLWVKSVTGALGVLSVGLVVFVMRFQQIMSYVMMALTDPEHGLAPRYLNIQYLYATNFEVLRIVPLGIGFTIPRQFDIYYTDSGYIVYYTMGGVVFTVAIYCLLLWFLRSNLRRYWGMMLFFMLFELATPSLLYVKTVLILVFAIPFLSSVDDPGRAKRRVVETARVGVHTGMDE